MHDSEFILGITLGKTRYDIMAEAWRSWMLYKDIATGELTGKVGVNGW